MLLQLKPLFMGERESLPIDTELDFSGLEWQGDYPFRQPVRVKGAVALTAEIVMLRARVSYVFGGRCDRCMEEFQGERELDVEHILVTSLENGDEGDFVLIDNYQLPLDELVEADLILSLPFKNLCREDCRGLCPICGKNLNEGLCGCRPQTADPRLEILRQLID